MSTTQGLGEHTVRVSTTVALSRVDRGIWGFIGIKLERGIRIQGLRVLIKNWIEGSNQKRELFQDLDPLLSNTFGTITALLQMTTHHTMIGESMPMPPQYLGPLGFSL